MKPRLFSCLAAGLWIGAGLSVATDLSAQTQPFQFARSESRDLFGVKAAASQWQNLQDPIDLNGDGIDDLVGGADTGFSPTGLKSDGVFLSRGGRFENLADRFPQLELTDVVGDLNGDGLIDLLAFDQNRNLVSLWNDGQSGFTPVPVSILGTPPFSFRPLFIGDLGNPLGQTLILDTQDGFETFTLFWQVFPTRELRLLPRQQVTRPTAPVNPGPAGWLRTIDVDQDGDLDLIDATSQTYLNDGQGSFAPGQMLETQFWPSNESAIPTVIADIDGNGILDFANNRIHYGQPTGGFIAPQIRPNHRILAARDFDGDGRTDLLWAERGVPGFSERFQIVWNTPNAGVFPSFLQGPTFDPVETALVNLIGLGDFDGDGLCDLVFESTRGFELYLNDGARGFDRVGPEGVVEQEADPLLGEEATKDLIRGDIDGDGDLDFAGRRILINVGGGQFVDETAVRILDPDPSNSFDLVDMDQDGDLDLIAYKSGFTRLFRNNGAGVFFLDLFAFPAIARETLDGAVFDYEGDGDLDVLLGDNDSTTPESGSVLVQNAMGAFREVVPSGFFGGSWRSVAGVDVDGDGDRDLIVRSTFASELQLIENFGPAGLGRPSALPFGGVDMSDFSAGDINGDGLTDLVGNRILLNDGFGRFSDQTSSLLDRASLDEPLFYQFGAHPADFAPRLVDVDGDGDLDFDYGEQRLAGFGRTAARVATNRLVQLSVEGFSDRGGFFDLRVDAAIGRSVGPRTATLLISGGSVRQAIPGLGVLRLDPSTLAVVGSSVIPAGELSARFALPIPDVAVLQGLELWSQAVVAEPLGRLRLTGAVRDVIR